MLNRSKSGLAGLSLFFLGKRVALIGLARSHTPLIPFFDALGALSVTARDRKEDPRPELAAQGAKLMLGERYLDDLDEDIILRTPAMRPDHPALEAARARGKCVTSEIELFLAFCPCKVYGITGSDGKTTTSTLVSKLLEASGKRVHLGGNIGEPLLPRIGQIAPEDAAVAELSSFQLMGCGVSPEVSIITNLSENHLDWHRDMDEYLDAKTHVFLHQAKEDLTVLNFDNAITRALSAKVPGRLRFFSRREDVKNGTFCLDGTLQRSDNGAVSPLFSRSEILVPGEHNLENYLAAIAATCDEVGIPDMLDVARAFGGVAHRMELVGVKNGVRFYNSSIDSTPARSIATLSSFAKPSVVLMGGYDKHLNYEPVAPLLTEHAKAVVLCGQTTQKICDALQNYPPFLKKKIPLARADSFDEAFRQAYAFCEPGDNLVLSPASASFDLFRDYEQRGERFRALVRGIKEERS